MHDSFIQVSSRLIRGISKRQRLSTTEHFCCSSALMSQFRPGLLVALLLAAIPNFAQPVPGNSRSSATGAPHSGSLNTDTASDSAAPYSVAGSWPGAQLESAQRSIARRHFAQAASQLREVATLLEREASRAGADTSTRLRRDAAELRQMADTVLAGNAIRRRHLDRKLATISASLAEHYYAQATKAWADSKLADAGDALAASARSVGQGLQLAGSATEDSLRAAASFGERLGRQSSVAVAMQFDTYRRAVAAAIVRLDRAIDKPMKD